MDLTPLVNFLFATSFVLPWVFSIIIVYQLLVD